MDRFLEAASSFLGLKNRRKKRIDKQQRGIALYLNSADRNEITVQETQNEKEVKLKDKGKLFVGGLNYATTSEELSAYFSKFGDVINGVVIKCPTSRKSRGFGFVSFLDPADAEKALQTKHHVLHGRTIECRPFDSKVDSKEIKPKKSEKARVFLGGLPVDITKNELEKFFSRYGKIVNIYLPVDGKTKQGKGFAFVTFENEDDAEKCIGERFVYLKGRRIFMNKADPRDGGPRPENATSGSHGSTLTDQDSLAEYTEDSASLPDEDTESSSSGQLNFELEQHPEFQQLFQNYFAKKLNHYSDMSGRENENRKQQLQSSEMKTLESFFRQMSVNSHWDLDQDTSSESEDSDTNDESFEEGCENLVSFLVPQIQVLESASKNSVGKSPSKVMLPFEKDKSDLKFSTQEFTESKLHAPMNFKNDSGILMCTECQWIPPNQSFEAFLAHCKTPTHKIKLIERFRESQTQGVKLESKVCMNNEKHKDSSSKVNFYPKVTGIHLDDSQRQNNVQGAQDCEKMQQTLQYFKLPEQPQTLQLVKEEVQKVEKVKKKKKKNKKKQEQMVLNSAQDGVPKTENKKQVSQSNKQNSQQETKDKMMNTLNLKIFALSKGMACIQALSENSLSCETCEKEIPSSSNFDALMRNVLVHLQSKKHLQKLLKNEDKLKNLLSKNLELGGTTNLDKKNSKKDTVEGNKTLAKKINSPKDQSLLPSKTSSMQEKTVLESKKLNAKDVAVKTQNAASKKEKGKTEGLGVKFLCLQCKFSNSSFEEFGPHLKSERHSSSSTPNGVPGAKNPECTECTYCNSFLFGSLYEINVHFSECSKKKG